MGIKIAVLSETHADEKRVATSPDMVKKLKDLGASLTIQKGAGINASIADADFKAAGATIGNSVADTLKGAHIILKVQPPTTDELKKYPKKSISVSLVNPFNNKPLIDLAAKSDVTLFAMEMVPRITRAQAMDVLSSQSNLAGYKSVLDACEHYGRAFPMMMTAAGTIPPAKVFIMGAGVAGLQAIATARRLGAVVSATDVRPAAKEQVESLGASFIAVEDDEFKEAETAGGYAKEMSAAYKKKQAALVEEHIAKQDIVITTALIPGRPAPELISESMVKSMKAGSVIVDLAVETGGNCACSEAGKVVKKHGVTLIGHNNVPSRLAADASMLYAKNVYNLLALIIDKESKAIKLDMDDDILKGLTLTHGGKIVHPNFETKKAPAQKAPAKKAPAKKAPAKKKPATKSKATAKKTSTKKPATKKKASS